MMRSPPLRFVGAACLVAFLAVALVVATRAALADRQQQSQAGRSPIPTYATVRSGVLEDWLPAELHRTPLFRTTLRGPALPAGYEPIVTEAPSAGAPIEAGSRIVEVATRPVFLFVGKTPAFREMRLGDRGADVKALQSGLRRAGIRTVRDDGVYGTATADAVRTFYARSGYTTDGQGAPLDGRRVMLGDILFMPSAPARLTKPMTVGMSLSGDSAPALESMASAYSIAVPVADASRVHRDNPVSSEGGTPPYEVGRVGAPIGTADLETSPDSEGNAQSAPTMQSFVLASPRVPNTIPDRAPVRVRVASSGNAGLIVPSVTLGGTPSAAWVQLQGSAGSSVVPVHVGLCALGECVVTTDNPGVRPGARLLIPSAAG